MNKLLPAMVLSMLFTTSHANQEAQDLCITQFGNQCQTKCDETNGVDCAQNCHDDAVRQCRQAGE